MHTLELEGLTRLHHLREDQEWHRNPRISELMKKWSASMKSVKKSPEVWVQPWIDSEFRAFWKQNLPSVRSEADIELELTKKLEIVELVKLYQLPLDKPWHSEQSISDLMQQYFRDLKKLTSSDRDITKAFTSFWNAHFESSVPHLELALRQRIRGTIQRKENANPMKLCKTDKRLKNDLSRDYQRSGVNYLRTRITQTLLEHINDVYKREGAHSKKPQLGQIREEMIEYFLLHHPQYHAHDVREWLIMGGRGLNLKRLAEIAMGQLGQVEASDERLYSLASAAADALASSNLVTFGAGADENRVKDRDYNLAAAAAAEVAADDSPLAADQGELDIFELADVASACGPGGNGKNIDAAVPNMVPKD